MEEEYWRKLFTFKSVQSPEIVKITELAKSLKINFTKPINKTREEEFKREINYVRDIATQISDRYGITTFNDLIKKINSLYEQLNSELEVIIFHKDKYFLETVTKKKDLSYSIAKFNKNFFNSTYILVHETDKGQILEPTLDYYLFKGMKFRLRLRGGYNLAELYFDTKTREKFNKKMVNLTSINKNMLIDVDEEDMEELLKSSDLDKDLKNRIRRVI